ncbi:MAG: hypothetical protein B6241_06775 [Spirochaetaceae bacterium 4572_59]|nr:MAG: hypothetical protein B6241_06775 [Spirochaetaceae bacterium 4572_59]
MKVLNRINSMEDKGVIAAFLVLFITATVMFEPFFSLLNIMNILRQVSMIGIVAIGMTFVILIKGIDLSVGALVAVSGVLSAYFAGRSMVLAILLPLLLGALLGAINGIIIARYRIVPFIATFAMMIGARGASYIATDTKSIAVPMTAKAYSKIGRGYAGLVPVPVIIFFLLLFIAYYILKNTSFGRKVYALGSNEEASLMMGIKVNRVKIAVYSISGLMCGAAGVILTSRLGAGQPVAGMGWEIQAIAATAIGGTLLSGGVGGVKGTFFGVLILGMITNMINLQGSLNSWWQGIITGVLLLIAIIVQAQEGRRIVSLS